VHSSYLRMALLYPKPKAEGIIARALGVTPMELWPERYTDEILANHRHWRRNDNVHAVKFNTNDKDSTVNR
jgi:lambda repressor-like predicted transcriptional regulator